MNIIKSVYGATGGKGVMVYDRGGDRPAFYAYLIENNRNFIIRLKGRSVISWKGMHYVHDLARECIMAYFATVWIGRNVKHEILAEHLKYLSKRIGQIPEFAAYSIAAELRGRIIL